MKKLAVLAATLLATYVPLHASAQWVVGPLSNPDMSMASTSNSEGDLLAINCFADSGKCTWGLSIQNGCHEGAPYLVLVNSARGASAQQVTCAGSYQSRGVTYYTYDFVETDQIELAISLGGTFGLAFWTDHGRLMVYRFNADGYKAARTEMRADLEKKARRKIGTRTESL